MATSISLATARVNACLTTVALSTSNAEVTITPPSGPGPDPEVTLVADVDWLYGSASDAVAFPVLANQALVLRIDGAGVTFFAKVGTGSGTLHPLRTL